MIDAANSQDTCFAQSDRNNWEFELDTMYNPSHQQLAEYLDETIETNNDTMEFLRGYLIDVHIKHIESF